MYGAEFDQDWPAHFGRLEKDVKERVAKKIRRILDYPSKRHLRKSLFFVDEVGQYRIIYRIFDDAMTVRFYFVGTHREYERWYGRGP